jgi:hypothetical protein
MLTQQSVGFGEALLAKCGNCLSQARIAGCQLDALGGDGVGSGPIARRAQFVEFQAPGSAGCNSTARRIAAIACSLRPAALHARPNS